ncbi:hypothetical protein [Actinoplanes sp. NPDC026670]|uniref:hypothetical protein n=1 Tax=Actinoplanes sp. NPDC026670 TaxID=3154700 RepID=UPI0033D3B3FD
MTGYLIGGIGAALLVILLVTTLLVRRTRANRHPADRDELLRRARQASGQITRDNKRLKKGSLRGGGLGGGSSSATD